MKRENLRDYMANPELIFTMLGEDGTKQKAVEIDARGFDECESLNLMYQQRNQLHKIFDAK